MLYVVKRPNPHLLEVRHSIVYHLWILTHLSSTSYRAFHVAFIFHLQLAVREVENGALLAPQENGVFNFALGETEIQERLSRGGRGG